MGGEDAKIADKTPLEYVGEIVVLLRRKSHKFALSLAKDAHKHYPDDPIVHSYYGCLTAAVGKNYDEGIKCCREALRLLKKSGYDSNSNYPSLYLNLGRAYLAAGDKKRAFDSFHRGLAKDEVNKDLLWELKKLGIRRPPVIPFLKRDNPINKYLGKLRHWILTKKPAF